MNIPTPDVSPPRRKPVHVLIRDTSPIGPELLPENINAVELIEGDAPSRWSELLRWSRNQVKLDLKKSAREFLKHGWKHPESTQGPSLREPQSGVVGWLQRHIWHLRASAEENQAWTDHVTSRGDELWTELWQARDTINRLAWIVEVMRQAEQEQVDLRAALARVLNGPHSSEQIACALERLRPNSTDDLNGTYDLRSSLSHILSGSYTLEQITDALEPVMRPCNNPLY
ncbi:hypothetical protein PQX77_018409 [Marasmius sp. AFHP31]|nr:hypothetical protein PQX77_018409 [Marasmius sp. AFHP31]